MRTTISASNMGKIAMRKMLLQSLVKAWAVVPGSFEPFADRSPSIWGLDQRILFASRLSERSQTIPIRLCNFPLATGSLKPKRSDE